MTNRLSLPPRYRRMLEDLLCEHVPNAEVWAYGSRINGQSHEGSDLDLVVRSPTLEPLGTEFLDLLEAFQESNIPILVQAHDWARLPESFHREIERDYVVVQECPLTSHVIGGNESGGRAPTATPADWCSVMLGECAELIRDSVSPSAMRDALYIGLEHIGEGALSLAGRGTAADVTSAKTRFRRGDILFGKLRPYFRKVIRAPADGLCSTDIWVVRADAGVDQDYLYYCMASQEFVDFVTAGSEGTRMPRANWGYAQSYTFPLPPLSEQRAIAHVLGALDDKIELNRRMNETLEAMARALFTSWFVDFEPVRAKMEGRDTGLPSDLAALFPERLVPSELGPIPEGWEVRALDSIADFLNGLALQKYPASGGSVLPVIKIAQLRAGHTQGADLASGDLPGEYKVNDGDVLFSWSGSLELTIWAGSQGALNQHLFKVTSQGYPQWLYYFWIRQHLPEFRGIAANKATTMGHIQRHHLSEALTVIPNTDTLESMSSHIQPLLERSLSLRLASRALATQRDALLPRLESGEVRV